MCCAHAATLCVCSRCLRIDGLTRLLFHCEVGRRKAAAAQLAHSLPALKGHPRSALAADPAGDLADDGAGVAATLEVLRAQTMAPPASAAARTFNVQDIRNLSNLLQNTSLEAQLRCSAGQQLCAYLANPQFAERVVRSVVFVWCRRLQVSFSPWCCGWQTPVMDEVLAGAVASLAAYDSPVALSALQLIAVIVQFCPPARAMLADRPSWLHTVLPFALRDARGPRAAALRAVAWCMFSPRVFRALPSRSAALCRREVVVVGPWSQHRSGGDSGGGETPDRLIPDPSRWFDLPWFAGPAFGELCAAVTGLNIRPWHVRSGHGGLAPWSLGPSLRPRVHRLVQCVLAKLAGDGDNNGEDGGQEAEWNPVARAQRLLSAVHTATNHQSFLHGLARLRDTVAAEPSVGVAVAHGAWVDVFAKFFEVRSACVCVCCCGSCVGHSDALLLVCEQHDPAIDQDRVVLCEVLSFLRDLVRLVRPTGLLVLASTFETRFLPLLERLVAGDPKSCRGVRNASSGGGDGGDSMVDWNVAEVMRVDEYQQISSGTPPVDHHHTAHLRMSLLELLQAVVATTTSQHPVNDNDSSQPLHGSDPVQPSELAMWVLEPLIGNGRMLAVLARVLNSPSSGAWFATWLWCTASVC